MMPQCADPFDLQRFLAAQEHVYATALSELRAGSKRTHWIWYVLPQYAGLGASSMARRYAIGSVAEARAYLRHPVLGARLAECVAALNALTGLSASTVLGAVDAVKFCSSMTLFAAIADTPSVFEAALARYFAGKRDGATLALMNAEDSRGH